MARREDLAGIVALLADDAISAARRGHVTAPTAAVEAAFAAIERDPAHELWIAEHPELGIVATLQLSFLPGLSRNGMLRAQVEAVRVRREMRGGGIGRRLMQHSIGLAREKGCGLVQLTTDRRREDAHRFYQQLGFESSHVGMKLDLASD